MHRTTFARTVGALAVSTTLAVTLAACTGSDDGQKGQDPAAVAEAIAKLDGTSHTLTLTAGDLMSGDMSVDPATDSYQGSVLVDPALTIAGEGDEKIGSDFIVIGEDQWWRLGGEEDVSWVHTAKTGEDFAKMAGLNLPQLRDELLASLEKVTNAGTGAFTATVDPTKLTVLGSGEPITVTIMLNDQGQLTHITGDLPDPAAEGTTITVAFAFTGYGEPVKVEAPDESEVTDLDN